MKPSSIIGHAIELFELARPLKHPVDSVVQEFFRKRHYLGSKDRRAISEIVYGIIRNYRLLRVYVEQALGPDESSKIPSVGLYTAYALRIQHGEREAVFANTESFWRLAYPNSDFRKFLDAIADAKLPQSVNADPANSLAIEFSLPDFVVEQWIAQFGHEITVTLCASMNAPAQTVIRVNTLKTTVAHCVDALREVGIESEPTKFSPEGLVLAKRVNAQALKPFKDGWFEMQDEGSQLLSYLLQPEPGQTIVDACAGGGGKTLHIAALMKNQGKLYSLDIDKNRLENIRPRILRAGVTIAQLHNSNTSQELVAQLSQRADSVLVDAPCSGSGTFRRNPAAKLSLKEEFVDRITKTQLSVIETYSRLVKPGGRLVYTTCSLLRQENEDIIKSFLDSHGEFRIISASEILRQNGIVLEQPGDFLTLLPHITGTDGFFASVLARAR